MTAVSSFLAAHNGWITEASNHADAETRELFMRQEILADSLIIDIETLREQFAPIAAKFSMHWRVSDSARKKRVVILVSKQEHCLYDLLSRWQSDELNIDIPCVISNHETFRGLVEWHGIRFEHVPVTPDNKLAAYAKVEQIYQEAQGDVMVLARPTCKSCHPVCAIATRARSSIFTTVSCPASSAPSPITRPSIEV